MPFINKQLLGASINSEELELLAGEDDILLNEAISQADDMITGYTGVTPDDEASSNDAKLRKCASAIVVFTLMGQQNGINETTYNYRKTEYDNAIHTLEQIQEGNLKGKVATSEVVASFGSTKRISSW